MTPSILRYMAVGFLLVAWAVLKFLKLDDPALITTIQTLIGMVTAYHLTLTNPSTGTDGVAPQSMESPK